MTLDQLITDLRIHAEKNPEEREAAFAIIDWIEKHGEFAFQRENLEWHITGSLLIANQERTKVLLMFHKKLQLWLQFGGHADGETDIKNVAIREFHEESGIQIELMMIGGIFNVDVLISRESMSTSSHLDILFLGIIPEDTPFSRQEWK